MVLRVSAAIINAVIEHPAHEAYIHLRQWLHSIRNFYKLLCPYSLQRIAVFGHSLPLSHVGLPPGKDLIPSLYEAIKELCLIKDVALKAMPLPFLFIPLATLPCVHLSPAPGKRPSGISMAATAADHLM